MSGDDMHEAIQTGFHDDSRHEWMILTILDLETDRHDEFT